MKGLCLLKSFAAHCFPLLVSKIKAERMLRCVAGLMMGCLPILSMATTLGVFTQRIEGEIYEHNINRLIYSGVLTPGDGYDSWSAITTSDFNRMDTETLLSRYDTLIMPSLTPPSMDANWTTILMPYLEAGGSILWQDARNIGDLVFSGLTLTDRTDMYSNLEPEAVTLWDEFGAFDAQVVLQPEYGISKVKPEWNVWAMADDDQILGVYQEFESGGRIIISVSDSLAKPSYFQQENVPFFQLTTNQLNWLNYAEEDIDVPDAHVRIAEPVQILALFFVGLFSLFLTRR